MKISRNQGAKRKIQQNCHDGTGSILFREVFSKADFKSSLEHVHETVVEPHSTIGYHLHSGNEEIYYILEGEGVMTVNNEVIKIVAGDAIITHSGDWHGLVNESNAKIKLLVFQCNY